MERARRQPEREAQRPAAPAPEIAGAVEVERARVDAETQPHAEAGADAFDETAGFRALHRGAGDGSAAGEPVVSGPDDATAVAVEAKPHDHRHLVPARGRKRRPDEPAELRHCAAPAAC